jgi:hypothetical protein
MKEGFICDRNKGVIIAQEGLVLVLLEEHHLPYS